MNIFEQLLEIKTGKKDFQIKAVFVPNSTSLWKWTYYIYYYDIFTHTFYINDIDKTTSRTSAINIIEHITKKAYSQEMNSFVNPLKRILAHKKPKVFCLYYQKLTGSIVIDKVSLKVLRDKSWEIISFENPSWQRCKYDMKEKFSSILENKSITF